MESLEYLFGLEFHGHKFGLENIRALTGALGRPQAAYRTVCVAGTNGKGSVCAMVARALTAAGHRTGLYTSPHLVTLRERFVVDGEMVTDVEMAAALDEVRTTIDRLLEHGGLRAQPTFFEVVTSMALVMFRQRRVDIAVLEVGLGGRLDATTVATPIAGAITTIDLDHQAHLGGTIRAIAAEKVGIAKPGMVVVCGERKPEAVDVIDEVCRRQGASLVQAWDGVDVSASSRAGLTTMALRTPARSYAPCTLALRGVHQIGNAVVAVRLLEALDAAGVSVPPPAVVDGLTRARWPCRLELVSFDDGREMLLDAAHNPAGAECLAAYLRDAYPEGLPLVFGAMRDKDIEGMLRVLLPHATRIMLTSPPSPRAAPPAELGALIATLKPELPIQIEPDPSKAVACAFQFGRAICVAGSIFLLGAILPTIPQHGRTD
ncbi:MAG: bifunctional folylpolyglutamate synthase/dihydrofolate synthase [Acidobacteria bacterium]|nr:bifunctional folylpolyglutamate synthase/dihydrofolate synthase [Acidobacteriota bacterium]